MNRSKYLKYLTSKKPENKQNILSERKCLKNTAETHECCNPQSSYCKDDYNYRDSSQSKKPINRTIDLQSIKESFKRNRDKQIKSIDISNHTLSINNGYFNYSVIKKSKLKLKSRNIKCQAESVKSMHKHSNSSTSYMKYQSLCSFSKKGANAVADHGDELKTKLQLEDSSKPISSRNKICPFRSNLDKILEIKRKNILSISHDLKQRLKESLVQIQSSQVNTPSKISQKQCLISKLNKCKHSTLKFYDQSLKTSKQSSDGGKTHCKKLSALQIKIRPNTPFIPQISSPYVNKNEKQSLFITDDTNTHKLKNQSCALKILKNNAKF